MWLWRNNILFHVCKYLSNNYILHFNSLFILFHSFSYFSNFLIFRFFLFPFIFRGLDFFILFQMGSIFILLMVRLCHRIRILMMPLFDPSFHFPQKYWVCIMAPTMTKPRKRGFGLWPQPSPNPPLGLYHDPNHDQTHVQTQVSVCHIFGEKW